METVTDKAGDVETVPPEGEAKEIEAKEIQEELTKAISGKPSTEQEKENEKDEKTEKP